MAVVASRTPVLTRGVAVSISNPLLWPLWGGNGPPFMFAKSLKRKSLDAGSELSPWAKAYAEGWAHESPPTMLSRGSPERLNRLAPS